MASRSSYSSSHGSRAPKEFLRRRVALFGLVSGALVLFLLIPRVVFHLLVEHGTLFDDPSFLFHGLAAVAFLAVYGLCAGPGARSRPYLDAVQFAGLFAGCAALIAMGAYVAPAYRPELVVTIVLTQGLLARAVVIPSSARLTLWLTALVGVPMILAAWFAYERIDQEVWQSAGGQWGDLGRAGIAGAKAAMIAALWTGTTLLCGATSRILYGLRREVDEARQLGQYTLEEKLGEGAMGMVYRASHAMLRRPTAVKLLLPDKVGEANLVRFEREVQQTARLTHPHTVTIFDYGRTPDGIFYYAMELLEGAALESIVELTGPMPPERVAYLMDQVAAALSEAHGIGLIHRDIKPANIILTTQGGEYDVAKVVDFGLVKDIAGEGEAALSRADTVAGTPLYMSPETIVAYQDVDFRSDLYSLGAVCYYLLTGEPVFKGRTAGEVVTQHLNAEPVPPSKRRDGSVPSDLEALVLACLRKDPGERPQTANHLRARLWAGGTRNKWNTDRARRWWREHADELRERRWGETGERPESNRTIAVDLNEYRGRLTRDG